MLLACLCIGNNNTINPTFIFAADDIPTPTATPTLTPTATPTLAPTATPTLAPTATPIPTSTPAPTPTPTATPVPTATPIPSPTPSIRPTATPILKSTPITSNPRNNPMTAQQQQVLGQQNQGNNLFEIPSATDSSEKIETFSSSDNNIISKIFIIIGIIFIAFCAILVLYPRVQEYFKQKSNEQ